MKHLRSTGIFYLLTLSLLLFSCSPDDGDHKDNANDDSFDERHFKVELAGENQVPPIATPATGTMEVDLDKNHVLKVEGSFKNLVSRLKNVDGSSIHLYVGSADEEGSIVFNVNVDADKDNRGGKFTLTETLSADQVRIFESNDYYLKIHTTAYPDGELRGQLDPDAPEYANIDESWGLELSPQEQPHQVDSDAKGWAWAILRDDDTFLLSGALNNIEGDLTEVQLMSGEGAEAGIIVATLNSEERDDGGYRFWYETEFSEDQIDDLEDGMYYINVFTTDQPLGELRGRIDETKNFFENIWEDLFGDDPTDIETAPPF